jgi:membrane fusion protein (multidrug efflux system)
MDIHEIKILFLPVVFLNSNYMKKDSIMKSSLVLLLSLSMLIIGCTRSIKSKQTDAGRRFSAISVEVKVLKPGQLLNEFYTTGSILANEKVELRSEVSGRITGIFFEEGSQVKKGALLLKINDSELQAQLTKAEAQQKLAELEEFRNRKLLELKAISQEEYDVSLNQLKAIQAEKQLLEAQIEKTEILAPLSGKIGLRYVSPGSYMPSNSLIAILQQVDPIKVEFSVPEKYSLTIKKGMHLSFTVENFDRSFEGVIYAVESGIDPQTRSIKVRATSPNPGSLLMPGTYARISLILENIPDALTIPSESLITELEGTKVYICQNGKAVSVPVVTGIRTGTDIQITSGLSAGDSLITTGLLQISNGMPVVVKTSGTVTGKSDSN